MMSQMADLFASLIFPFLCLQDIQLPNYPLRDSLISTMISLKVLLLLGATGTFILCRWLYVRADIRRSGYIVDGIDCYRDVTLGW
jgi:hypothetical protein